jgi:hypothetical protein
MYCNPTILSSHYTDRLISFRKNEVSLGWLQTFQTSNNMYKITEFLDFFHRPVFLEVEIRRFVNCICFRPQAKGVVVTYSIGSVIITRPVNKISSF